MLKLSNDELMWKRSSAKDMFQTQRMWPTFAGAKADLSKEVTGLLPVYVWPEQKIYLENHPKVAIVTESKKRKLDSSADDTSRNESEPQQRKKHKSNFFNDSLIVPVQKLFENVKNVFTSSFGWFFGSHKTTNDDNATQNNTSGSNEIKMEVEVTKSQEPVSEPVAVSLEVTKTPSISHLPHDERVKYTVFKSLQDQSYFIGPGDVYGGDYSVYKGGDPSQTHSTGIVRVLQSNMVSAKEILAFSRVQNQVAKSSVFAFVTSNQTTTTSTDKHSHKRVVRNGSLVPSGRKLTITPLSTQSVSSSSTSGVEGLPEEEQNEVISVEEEEVEEVLTANFLVINFKSVSDRNNI